MDNKVIYMPTFPILGILGLIFITLKLTGHIAWSWWWVLAPFWFPILANIVYVLVLAVICGVVSMILKFSGRKRFGGL